MSTYYVYITTNIHKTVLYTGVTNNLIHRITEHYLDRTEKKHFTGKYNAYWLVYYEEHKYIDNAIAREKEIKAWRREKKDALIAMDNPEWRFYNKEIFGQWPPDERELIARKDMEG